MYLTEWKDIYEYDRITGNKKIMTKEDFENKFGEFIVAFYDEDHDTKLPKCLWSKKYVVVTEKSPLEIFIRAYLRNPESEVE